MQNFSTERRLSKLIKQICLAGDKNSRESSDNFDQDSGISF